MHEYPYQDLETSQLPGETWEPIPEYEDYYEVSDLGRVRSVDRVIPHPRIKSQFVKGRILKQKVQVNQNTISDTPMIDLQVSLSKDGKQHFRNVRRLVYSAFVQPLSYLQDHLYVINKDCDGYNNKLSNITCVSVKQKSQRAFDRGRVPESILKYADRSSWRKHRGNCKPIQELDMKGNLIRTYESVREASRKSGVREERIIDVAKGRYKSWKGYRWEYVNPDHKARRQGDKRNN